MKLFESIQKNNYKLVIDQQLNYDEEKINTCKRFISFCYKELGLAKECTIKLVADREAHGIKTTAFWHEQTATTCIYALNRMLVDVMRSLAHELVHKQQYEQKRITFPVPDIGGEIEDEANAMAGVLIKKFLNFDENGKNLIEGKKFS